MRRLMSRTRIFALVARIPRGRVVTYGDLARAVGRPRAARAVGAIVRCNPHLVRVPCHRVVKSNGSVGGYARGTHAKKTLLNGEGIVVRKGKIEDFKRVRVKL